jgi:hypothetical protein
LERVGVCAIVRRMLGTTNLVVLLAAIRVQRLAAAKTRDAMLSFLPDV